MKLSKITSRLVRTTNFVEVAIAICKIGRQAFRLHQLTVSLYASSGRPVVCVDNVPGMADRHRTWWVSKRWVTDPYLLSMQQHFAPVGEELIPAAKFMKLARGVGYDGDPVHVLLLPLLQPTGLLGSIRCGNRTRFTAALRRDLTVLSNLASVQLAHLAVTAAPDPRFARLSSRQRDVAHLAACGRSNDQIASTLRLSENTVKTHLKNVFERLRVSNRTELARLMAKAGPVHDVPVGVTRIGDITITRGF